MSTANHFNCGYTRKHAIRLLRNFKRYAKMKPKKRGRQTIYNKSEIIRPLKRIWLAANLPCSKSLKPLIELWLPAMKLLDKQRIAGKIIKRHDKPITPYQKSYEISISQHLSLWTYGKVEKFIVKITGMVFIGRKQTYCRERMNKKQINLIILILAGIAIGSALGFFSLKNKSIGPYEYVRKARKYVDAGKYKKAIYLLHKACEELPDNEDVKKNLLYGYARYADVLEREGKLDQAIEYLEMALEMGKADQVVANNLAILYCQKGVQLSNAKKYSIAMDYLNRAEEAAMVSKKIRRNVANYLFNAAVRAYNKNDGRTVFICLNVSYVLRGRFDTLYMLGQQFYKESDLEKARFYWEKALLFRPDDEGIKGNLEKIDKEIRHKGRMKEIRAEHFDIQLHRQYNIDENVLKNVLSDIYNRVGEDLRCYPSADTPIVFYNEEDFRDIFKQNGIVRGFYDGGSIRLIFITDLNSPLFPALIAHEYTHAAVSILTKNRCPVWLNEGLAVFEQSRYMAPPYQHVRVALDKGLRLSIDRLEQGFATLDDVFMTGLSYEGAHTAVLFILDKWGWAGLRGLLESIKEGRHFANAIDEEFYISVNIFEKMWNKYLQKKFKQQLGDG